MSLTPFGAGFGTSFDPFGTMTTDPYLGGRGMFGRGGLTDFGDLIPRLGGTTAGTDLTTAAGGATSPMDVVELPDRFEIRAGAQSQWRRIEPASILPVSLCRKVRKPLP